METIQNFNPVGPSVSDMNFGLILICNIEMLHEHQSQSNTFKNVLHNFPDTHNFTYSFHEK